MEQDNVTGDEIIDWTIPDEKGIIHVPDELDKLVNKIGFQIRFLTISGKGEIETICDIAYIAQKYFSSRLTSLEASNQFHKQQAHECLQEQYRQQKENEWVSVEDMPDIPVPGQRVLCFNENGSYFVGFKNQRRQWVIDTQLSAIDFFKLNITHWKPLPPKP